MKKTVKKKEIKKGVRKTSAQKFFEQVKLFDTGADYNAVENVYNKKDDIRNNFAEDIISEIDGALETIGDDYGLLIRKEIYLGITPEEPDQEADLATRYIQIAFLKELENIGIVKNLKEIRKEDEVSQCLLDYAVISFYPRELKEYLKENKGVMKDRGKTTHQTTDQEKHDSLFVFILTKNGTLSRKNPIEGDRPYQIEDGKLPILILQELVKARDVNNNFFNTNELADILNVKANKIRKAISGMKIRAEKMFKGIHRDDFIEGYKNSGYRLHRQIRIIKI